MPIHTIITALCADRGLSQLVNGIYNNAPADAKYPYIAVDNLAATGTYSGWHARITVKIFSSTRSSMQVADILSNIRRILDDTSPSGSIYIWQTECNISRAGLVWVGNSVFNVILQENGGIFTGNQLVVKIGNGDTPEIFSAIGGLQSSNISLENKIVDCSNLNSGKWRCLVNNAGIAACSISGDGFFTNCDVGERLRLLAFTGGCNNYEIMLGGNSKITGAFIVASYKRYGDVNEEEGFSLRLESSGVVGLSKK